MEERCDGKVHCQDGSDEDDCTLVMLDPGYSKVVVPTGPDGLLHLTLDLVIRNRVVLVYHVTLITISIQGNCSD